MFTRMIDQKKCFECGNVATENHHVVPLSRGGTKTLPLCANCHGLVHGVRRTDDASTLIKDALAALKRRGAQLGNPNGWTDDAQEKATAAKRRNAKKNSNTRKAKNRIRELIELAQFKNQALTIETVAERLNDAGLRTTRGKKFTRYNVRYLLDQVLREMDLSKLPKGSFLIPSISIGLNTHQ